MAYMNKNAELKNGYNAYIDLCGRHGYPDGRGPADGGGDTTSMRMPKRGGNLLFSGSVTYEWTGRRWRPTALTASTTMPTACWPVAARR